jgi:pentatricopeptide repeat protein
MKFRMMVIAFTMLAISVVAQARTERVCRIYYGVGTSFKDAEDMINDMMRAGWVVDKLSSAHNSVVVIYIRVTK